MFEMSLINNVIEYFYRFSFFIVMIFLLSRYTAFDRLFYRKDLTRSQELFLIAITGVISIISSQIFSEAGAPLFLPLIFGVYSGMSIGTGVSFILAICLFIAGQPFFTAVLCLSAGPLGALMGRRVLPGRRKPFYVSIVAGIITLLGFSKGDKPFISLIPDMVANDPRWFFNIVLYLSVYVAGCFLLMSLLETIIADEDKKKALQTHNVLKLVGDAIDQIRKGITEENAKEMCMSLKKSLDIPGVCLIKRNECLFFPGSVPHAYPQTTETFKNIHRRVFDEGMVFEGDHTLIFGGCAKGCQFTTVFLLPLNDGQRVETAVGFLQSTSQAFSGTEQNLARGLSLIFSSELTRSKFEEQRVALESAKFKLLQAQINPHFLFNSLNTIAWMTGKDAAKAEELILHLSNFLRQSFDQKGEFVTLKKEIEYLKSYLFIEKARFMEKLQVNFLIDERALSLYIPPFLIQPLVENSIKHGISKKKEGGTIDIIVEIEEERGRVSVKDNGAGCTEERLKYILNPPAREQEDAPRRGIGVSNVKDRVTALFGQESQFEIRSTPGEGTIASFYFPKKGMIS